MLCNCTGNCMRVCSKCFGRLGCSGVCTCFTSVFYIKPIITVYSPVQFPDSVELDDDMRWYFAQEEEYEIKWDDTKCEKCPAD